MTDTIPGERIRRVVGNRAPGIAVRVVDPDGVRATGADGWADIAGHDAVHHRVVMGNATRYDLDAVARLAATW